MDDERLAALEAKVEHLKGQVLGLSLGALVRSHSGTGVSIEWTPSPDMPVAEAIRRWDEVVRHQQRATIESFRSPTASSDFRDGVRSVLQFFDPPDASHQRPTWVP